VDEPRKKRPLTHESASDGERRRIGKVVHDERGNASVLWRDAPADYERPVLEILGNGNSAPLSIKNEESYDPYARRGKRKGGGSTRTDLRKLSDWIKMMRDLEKRKRDDGGDGQD
jgi:hypothetical protein